MARIPTVFDYWGNAVQVGLVMAEAQAVIAMRVMGMMGVWSVPRSEDRRMVSEKVWAVTKAMTDASRASLSGGFVVQPDGVGSRLTAIIGMPGQSCAENTGEDIAASGNR